jgi:hypothetical protein
MGPNVQPQGAPWWQGKFPNNQGIPGGGWRGPTTGRPVMSGGAPPPVAPPVASPGVPTPPVTPPYTPVGRSPGGDPLVPNTGQVGTPVPMAGGSPGGLLGMLFDPSQHGNLAYAGMANAGNAGIPYTSASSRGMTDQILGQPIPTGGFGIGTGLPGGGSGLGTPVDVRAARLAATPDADQLAQVQGTGPDDFWNTIMQATRR